MKTRLNIKNFRIFDEDGVTFELNPITILTGCNSSGKSSMVKAIMLLNSFLSQIKKDIDNDSRVELNKYKLDFTQYPISLLGRFDKVINDRSNDKKVTLEYSIYSLVISKDVDVKLVFTVENNDDLKNGYLESITISIDGDVFYNSDKVLHKSICDLSIIKDHCVEFLTIQFLYDFQVGLYQSYEFDHKLSKDEYEERHKEVLSYMEKYSCDKITDNYNFNKTLHGNKLRRYEFLNEIDLSIVEWTQQYGSFFMIPVIEHLDTLSKNDIKTIVDNALFKDFQEVEIAIYQKIFKDYIESDFELFSDYFKSYETRFFECHDYEDSSLFKVSPCSIENSYFDLWQPQCFDDGKLIFERHGIGHYREVLDETLSFETLYGFLMLLNDKYCKEECKFYEKYESGYKYPQHRHKMYDYLCNVAKLLFEEVIVPDWTSCIEYVSSSTAKISRLYPLDAKDDFTELLIRYFENKRHNDNNPLKRYETGAFTNKWIKEFGVGERLSINYDEDGLGATIRLHKALDDVKGRLLADEGYGITQLVSIMLQIETIILSSKGKYPNRIIAPNSDLEDKDYRKFHYDVKTICIEEPEIHLHPKYQSLLADMFVEAYQEYNVHFIIETHSEYLIRRLQVLVGNKDKNTELKIKNEDISIVYINSQLDIEDNDEPLVKHINICEDGYLDDTFGSGFFDEASKLSKKLLF